MKSGRNIFKRGKGSGADIQESVALNKYDERLRVAAEKGDLAAFKSCLKKGGSFLKSNGEGLTATHFACHHGHVKIVEYMVQTEPSCVFAHDALDRSPVHHASKSGHLLCLQILSQGQHDNTMLCKQDKKGLAPLHYAAFQGHLSVVKFLCQQSCPPSPVDDAGVTPLTFACANGCRPVARELLDHSADINATDSQKKTALIWACEKGLKDIVDLLLRRGAKIDLPDIHNKTANDYAVELGHNAIRQQLEGQPKVATWEIGVPPGSSSQAVVTNNRPLSNSLSGTSLLSNSRQQQEQRQQQQQEVENSAAAAASSATAANTLIVASKSKNETAVAPAAAPGAQEYRRDVQVLQQQNEALALELRKVEAAKQQLELKTRGVERRLAGATSSGEEINGDMTEDPSEQIEDLTIQLGQVRRELRREADQRKKAEEEVETLKAQLSSYQADEREDEKKGNRADFSDDEEDALPGADHRDGPASPGAKGLLQAQEMITQLRRQLGTVRTENQRLQQLEASAPSNEVQTLRAEVKKLQYEKSILADQLEDSDSSPSVPNVPLAVYQDLKESQEQELRDVRQEVVDLQRQQQQQQQQQQQLAADRTNDGAMAREVTSLRAQLTGQEEEYNRTIQLYRQHILAASQGHIHPSVQQALASVAQLRRSGQR